MNEPVALRYDFDGNGYLYMDAGSGSDWASRVKDCEFLYTHQKNEWISVKDRFPPKDERFKNFSIPTLFCFGEWIYAGNYCFKDKNWYNNKFINEKKITHWMPLPNPPEVAE
jgi:hypothetical protein